MTEFPDSLKVRGLEKIYTGGYLGLCRSDFETDGSFFTLYGEDGSGKSTLLRLIAGLERADSGTAVCNGRDLLKLPPKERGVALFVNAPESFKRGKTVFYNISYPLVIRGASENVIKAKVAYMSAKFGVRDYLYTKYRDLSENGKARVALARSLIRECDLYLLDNPFAGFADDERAELLSVLKNTVSELGGLAIYATDKASELGAGDSCAVLYGGGVAQYGRLCDITAFPTDLGVAKILTPEISVFKATVSDDLKSLSAFGMRGELKAPPISDVYAGKEVLASLPPESFAIAADGFETVTSDVFHTPSHDSLKLSAKGGTLYVYAAPYSVKIGERTKVKVDFSRALLYDVHSEKIISEINFKERQL